MTWSEKQAHWKAEGLCIDCGEKRSEFNALHCEACREKHRLSCKRGYGLKRIAQIKARHNIMSFARKPKTL